MAEGLGENCDTGGFVCKDTVSCRTIKASTFVLKFSVIFQKVLLSMRGGGISSRDESC